MLQALPFQVGWLEISASIERTVLEIGFRCEAFASLRQAEGVLSGLEPYAAIVDLAVPTAGSKIMKAWPAHNDQTGGLAFIRAAKQKWRGTKFILLTGQPSLDAQQWCGENNVQYKLKPISKPQIEGMLGLRNPVAFVVHGRDAGALAKTKTALAALKITPVVLMEQPSKGRTVIEKFESVAGQCDLAIIAMSPDDIGGLDSTPMKKLQVRARQNVIFELGYFYGYFGRVSGRVVLIEFGNTEIPSDIAGVVRVDGAGSKAKLTKQLRVELDLR
jgi:predicted nucleotide-binding protein